ncbi:ABC transporter ATP-binding protein [Actinomyces urogenitalis]|uniref:ATP-binding cassette domain-containing protein n=1 Tax=Actinomyces urogenitalis TaxID=103621 RepID=UPI00242D2A0B|nr:ABC transporter ATP-binding protein [Actinomyces urogenitalis]MCI7456867.1 ABC transporter ATP-binding protein/permease [Actinomyces urogenitalis]
MSQPASMPDAAPSPDAVPSPHRTRAPHPARAVSPATTGATRSTREPRPALGTRRGCQATAAAAATTTAGALAQAWALICLGRGLGALSPSLMPVTPAARLADPTADWRASALQAVLAALVAAVCAGATQLIARSSAASEEGHIRRRVLAHLLDLGPGAVSEARSGATVALLTDGAERVAAYRQTFLAPTIAAVSSPLLVLALTAVTVDAVSAAVLALLFVAVPGGIALAHKRLRRSSGGSRSQRMRLAAEYLDALQGLTTLALTRAASRRGAALRERGEANRRALMRLLAGNQLVILVTDGLFSLLLITVAAALALARLADGALDLGGALALVLVSLTLLEPLDHVGSFFYVGMGGMANQRAMRRVLARRCPVTATCSPADDVAASRPGTRAEPVVALRSVSAAWPSPVVLGAGHPDGRPGGQPGGRRGDRSGRPAEGHPGARPAGPGHQTANGSSERRAQEHRLRPVLTDVDLEVPAGQRLAVVGPSGAGKSTLLALLAGDLLPTSGTVSINGTRSSVATADEVRGASALVTQSTWLFTGTIADNLRLADPDATPERMWWALEAANLADEVRAMPQGLETAVGERGMSLSGGQAQRLSLARAFLADRPLLLLDEPTSQVDLASEAQIVEAIERLAEGRTVVTVSHRAGALTACDRVVTVENGGLR